MTWGIVADDLTGAADTAVPFARLGDAWVVRHGSMTLALPSDDGAVLCVDTTSRSLPIEAAVARVRAATAWLRDRGCRHLYKKIDSTLRGHVGVELDVLLEVAGYPAAIVAPAFPGQGRVTIDGFQRFGAGSRVHVPSLLRTSAARPMAHVPLRVTRAGVTPCVEAFQRQMRGGALLVVDAETDEDLGTIAKAARCLPEWPVMCGSAGLARAIAVIEGSTAAAKLARPVGVQGPVWAIVGTTHPATQAQVAFLRQHGGARVIALSPAEFLREETRQRIVEEIVRAFQDGVDVVTHVLAEPVVPESASSAAAPLGSLAPAVIERARVGALILSGGETAECTCDALGAWGLRMEAELLPGIPLARLMDFREMPVVTKAGGFGNNRTLLEILAALRGPKEVATRREG